MSEIDKIKIKIANTEADLADAKKSGDRELIIIYGNQLIEQTAVWKNLLASQSSVAQAEIDHRKFPLYFDVLKIVGLQTPYEQYTLYASFGIFVYGSYTPARKAFFLNRWLHAVDPSLKDIWAARANLSPAEQKGGERYLKELKKVPKRYAVLPLSFLLIEGIRSGYCKLSSFFTRKI